MKILQAGGLLMAARGEVTVSRAEFARRIGVSRSRVSQMISEGTIGADALEGEGRDSRIRVVATAQVAERRHSGQAAGNGASTLSGAPAGTAGDGVLGRLQTGRILQTIEDVNAGMLTDFATAVVGRF